MTWTVELVLQFHDYPPDDEDIEELLDAIVVSRHEEEN